MDQLNWLAVLANALVPMIVGFVYYHPKVAGGIWMRENGFSMEDMQKGNMAKILGLTLVLSVMLSMFFVPLTIHAAHLMSLIAQPGGGPPDMNSPAFTEASAFLEKYGGNFRTFKHGAFHGVLGALFMAWPVIGINSLFERRGWKYTAIHLGYWVITFGIMGGVICAFA